MLDQPNQKIRKDCKRYGIPLWKLAQKVGVSEQTIIRWLREELPHERQQQLTAIIEEIKKEVIS